MKVVKSDRISFFDVDDTLILWNEVDADLPIVYIGDREFQIHTGHVKKIKDHSLMGFTIVVWSNSGHKWAERIVKALGLEEYVDYAMCKPHRVFDDSKNLSDTIKHGYMPFEEKK